MKEKLGKFRDSIIDHMPESRIEPYYGVFFVDLVCYILSKLLILWFLTSILATLPTIPISIAGLMGANIGAIEIFIICYSIPAYIYGAYALTTNIKNNINDYNYRNQNK